MFGRKNKDEAAADHEPDRFEDLRGDAPEPDADSERVEEFEVTEERGPYDASEFDPADLEQEAAARLDLGSVLVPLPEGGQIQVEMSPDGSPQAVHLVTEHGRITVAAYAAPKSPGQWREVAGDLAESLRTDNAGVSVESGPWGRELHAVTPNADLRFIGIDGYRWMIRCVAAGPTGTAGVDSPLAETAREVLRETIVNRGDEPNPVRTPLPVVLPQVLAEQLIAAQQQQMQAQQQQMESQQLQAQQQAVAEQQAVVTEAVLDQSEPPASPEERPGGSGSAMQQLGR
ncbi:DUF3710 domain-containing protein [Rhodococcus spelaei]|uniref:DUF3710 domain-containing protein n=1 Tax=Rhodococcus spelaei TaxID=2546320 RepID=UPI001FE81DDD|nr:DUF3710 domain-containing protein [Rhodococcus spelaei]